MSDSHAVVARLASQHADAPPATGLHFVLPGETTGIADVTLRQAGPRRSAWLPRLLDELLATSARTLRDRVASITPAAVADRRVPQGLAAALTEGGLTALGDAGADTPSPYASALATWALRRWDTVRDPTDPRVDDDLDAPALVEDLNRVAPDLEVPSRAARGGARADRTGITGAQDVVDSDYRREWRRDVRRTLLDHVRGRGVDVDVQAQLRRGPVATHRLLDERATVVQVRLDAAAWRDLGDRRTGKRALETLATLAEGVRVELVLSSPGLLEALRSRYGDWLDQHAAADLTERWDPTPDTPTPGVEVDDDLAALTDALAAGVDYHDVRAAMDDWPEQASKTALIAALPDAGHRTRADLVADPRLDAAASTVDAYLAEAENAGLVEISRNTTGSNRIALTALGRALRACIADDLQFRDPLQRTLSSDLTPTPQVHSGTVCRARQGREGGEAGQPGRPSAVDAAVARTGDATADGWVQWLGRADSQMSPWAVHKRYTAASAVEGVSLVDDPVAPFEDGRVAKLSVFDDELLAMAEWGGSLPTLGRILGALLSDKALSKVLGPDALGDTFEGVHDGLVEQLKHDLNDLLRLGMQIGWLSEDELTWNSWRERIGRVRCLLLEDVGRLQHSDDIEARTELYRSLQGAIATATALYDAVDVDVVINIRVPDTATLHRKTDVRRDFRRFFRKTVPKSAVYRSPTGVHSWFRQVLEEREEKLQRRLPVGVTPERPTAEMTASWVVSGPTVTDLQDEIRDGIRAETDHVREQVAAGDEEMPALEIPVVNADTTPHIRAVLDEFASIKGYSLRALDSVATEEARQAVETLVRACCATTGPAERPGAANPCDVAEALLRCASTDRHGDHLGIEELGYGLARLPPERLLPGVRTSTTAIIAAVLRADDPLGRSEIIERAEISASTYDRRLDEAVAAGVLDERRRDGRRCWTGSLIPWWAESVGRDRPDDAPTPRLPGCARPQDVLAELEATLDVELPYGVLAWPPSIDEAWTDPRLEGWRSWITAWAAGVDDPPMAVDAPPLAHGALIELGRRPDGAEPSQSQLPTADAPSSREYGPVKAPPTASDPGVWAADGDSPTGEGLE